MAFAISGTLGVDFEKTYTDKDIEPFRLGAEELGSDGVTYKFVRHAAAKTDGLAYILGSDFTLGDGVTTSGVSVAPVAVGVPQVDLEAPDAGIDYAFSWVAIKGPLSVRGVAPCAANVELFTTSVSGLLNSTISGAKRVDGFKFTATVSADSAITAAYATNYITVPTDA